MKLSEKTVNALKNFATINTSLLVADGNLQRSWNSDETILVEANLPDEFPSEFGVYDLPQFLANVTTLNNPEITFDKTFLTLSDGTIELDYFYCSPALIKSPPKNTLDIGHPDVEFVLQQASFVKLLKIASLNALTVLTIAGSNGKLSLKTHEKGVAGSNQANMGLGEYEGKDFTASFAIENLKMLPDDYNVKVNLAGFALFENKDNTMKYFIALEK